MLLWLSTTVATSLPTLVLVLTLELLVTLLLDVIEAAIAGCSRRQSRKAALMRNFMVLPADLRRAAKRIPLH